MNSNAQAGLTVYGAGASGARSVSFDAEPGIRVLVAPASDEENERAVALAAALSGMAQARTAAEVALQDLRRKLEAARAKIAELEAINAAAISGRRRFFGPVLMKPARPGDWSGEVWLLDPAKQERGLGLSFASLAEVRMQHPELWVVGTTADGVLLDAMVLQ